MMKKLLLILLCFPLITLAQQTFVPDDNFENYLEANGMGDGISNNDSVFTSAINTTTYLCINSLAISNLSGIEDFLNLEELVCYDNNITTLNLNQNMNLEIIRCSGNNLTSLLIDSCLNLEYLECQTNFLSSLNLSNNSLLNQLHCNQNNLTTLDLSSNTNLTEVNCSENYLGYLNTNNCSSLIILNCGNNVLGSINLTTNTNLRDLECYNNNIDSLNIIYNTQIEIILFEGNNLTQIDASNNMFLQELQCYSNNITELHLENCSFLERLECSENQIDSLDVTNNLYLKYLICNSNNLTSLDVSNNTYLQDLDCYGNNIDSLNLTNNVNLDLLWSGNNNLNFLDLRNGNNQLITSYDSWGNPNLYCISVDDTSWSNTHWTQIDSWTVFSTNCNNIYGCTDTLSCNYNASANIDDGSCLLKGCIDSSACNYDVNASCDDSSCIYVNTSTSTSHVSCNGDTSGSVVATANGGVSPYQYSLGGGLSQASGTFLNLTAGAYFLDVTDINGCSSNQIFTITEPNTLFANLLLTNVSCYGYCDGSAFSVPIGGTSPYTYDWSNLSFTDAVSSLCAGVYSVIITDYIGCAYLSTFAITEPLPLVLNNTINGCDSVLIGSNYYTISGAYIDTLTSVIGCDSVVNTNLTIDQNTSSYDTLSVGASIVWNGMPLNVSGDYSVTLINSVGCDSIVNLNLTVTTTGISEIANNKSNIVKITDMLGQETPYRRNTPLFYIYDDGTVEKRIVIE